MPSTQSPIERSRYNRWRCECILHRIAAALAECKQLFSTRRQEVIRIINTLARFMFMEKKNVFAPSDYVTRAYTHTRTSNTHGTRSFRFLFSVFFPSSFLSSHTLTYENYCTRAVWDVCCWIFNIYYSHLYVRISRMCIFRRIVYFRFQCTASESE